MVACSGQDTGYQSVMLHRESCASGGHGSTDDCESAAAISRNIGISHGARDDLIEETLYIVQKCRIDAGRNNVVGEGARVPIYCKGHKFPPNFALAAHQRYA